MEKQFWDLIVELSDLWLDIKDMEWNKLAWFNEKWTKELANFIKDYEKEEKEV